MQKMLPDCIQERVFDRKMNPKCKKIRLRRAYCYRDPLSNAPKV